MTQQERKLEDLIPTLPFASTDGETINWWDVPDEAKPADIETGAVYARIALAAAREDNRVITHILADMIERGKLGCLEVGFIVEIGSAARVGGMN